VPISRMPEKNKRVQRQRGSGCKFETNVRGTRRIQNDHLARRGHFASESVAGLPTSKAQK
ncbi:MAG: hypothetical protein LBG12_02465, partial [Synergistaceae bacterium]|nr:hypothetical protein [Synergistaceae bacterium]